MARIISFSSGKGGAGKTLCSVNFASELVSKGYKVLVFDIDINCSNVFILLQVKPQSKLQQYFEGDITLKDCVLNSPFDIDVISAGVNIQKLLQFESDFYLSKLANDLKTLSDEYDYVIIDYAAGITQSMIKFYDISDDIILVANPEITSLTDLYRLIKMICSNKITEKIYLIVNKVKNIDWAVNLYKEIKKVVDKFELNIELNLLGPILFDEEKVMMSIQKRTPLIILYPRTPIKGGFSLAVTRYLYDIGELKDDNNIKDKAFLDFF